ncbi:PBP1A family penicillin-binding protein [Patescibacteria group bacterium]|nr:PBP1A family penicillin-binding protein [Patescibacteria group bacterium]
MAKRKRHLKVYEKSPRSKIGKRVGLLFRSLGFGFLVLLLGSLSLFIYYAKDLPRPEKFLERQFFQSTKIYDRSGETLLYEIYGEEKREIVPLEKVPEYLKEAVIATEDINFYHHFGIDFKAVARAVLNNLKLGKPIQGGSTISQQLIRSSFLTMEKTLERKTREIILTLELERRYSKDQILGFYLNQIPFGSNAYGVEAASQTYFRKPVSDISLAEAALLASLIKAPSRLSPFGDNLAELLARKDYVLDRMELSGFITKEKKELAKKEEIKFAKALHPIKAPHFVLYIKNYLELKYGEDFLREKGLRVYTSLDWELQELAEKVVEEGAKTNENYRAFNASLVAIDPKTGQILAMVGSRDWFGNPYPQGCIPGKTCLFDPSPNVSLLGRQPGSAFKPFVYATAFKKGFNDKYKVLDKETNFGLWGGKPYIPQNYDGLFRGPVTLREGLAQSLNVPSVKVLAYLAGLKDSIKTAKDLGITTLDKPPSWYGLALVLGGGEVKLLDMVSAYGVFATEGLRTPPVAILRVEDERGNIIEENKKTPKRVLETEVARLINDILSDNQARTPVFGPSSPLYLEDSKVAAKTGTTENYKDGWVIGYTPSIVAGVWVGNNDGTPMRKGPGVVVAGPIWHQFMEEALLKYPKETFKKPFPN